MNWKTLLALTAAAAFAGPALAEPVRVHGCPSRLLETMDEPSDLSKPLTLEQISCVPFKSSPFTMSDATVSPDGRYIMRWHGGIPAPIEAASLTATKLFELPNRVAFRDGLGLAGSDPIAWSRDSRSLLTVRQDTVVPSGWALGGLTPVRIDLAGTSRLLPELKHKAGPLDALMWIGGEGLALAQFGTRGDYYRPEHRDPMPTIAIVDAVRGKVRAAFPAASIPELRPRLKTFGLRVEGATASILPNGRVRAVMQFRTSTDYAKQVPGESGAKVVSPGFRLIWTEGGAPRTVQADLVRTLALTPDGSKLLAIHSLQPMGVVISECQECPPDPPPTPVMGPIAELTDVQTGALLWRITLRAEKSWSQSASPAISADGRFALIEIPPENLRSMIALVSMKDGRILQRFSAVAVGSYPQTLGFSPDGHSIWLTCNNLVVRYRLNVRQPTSLLD